MWALTRSPDYVLPPTLPRRDGHRRIVWLESHVELQGPRIDVLELQSDGNGLALATRYIARSRGIRWLVRACRGLI